MSEWRVGLVSAFGRGETLALALHEQGFKVEVLDLTAAFPPEYHRGVGPFPVLNQVYLPAQRDLTKLVEPLPQGLTLWLKSGPVELNGPLTEVHVTREPALRTWCNKETPRDFTHGWLGRWLASWASPLMTESWEVRAGDTEFPARSEMGLIPHSLGPHAMSFEMLHEKGLTVRSAQSLKDLRAEGARLREIEFESGSSKVLTADQWVWCLSSFETRSLAEAMAKKLFWRGVVAPTWNWMSFEATMAQGAWSDGLPAYSVVLGDVYLPWTYSNMFVLRRLEGSRLRVWIKVPRSRVEDVDARRGWALGVENLLRSRLALADFRVDAGAWSLCPHSAIYAPESVIENPGPWKNWDLISSENLPRLDWSARLEREAQSFARLSAWRNEQLKKRGGRRDQALHAP